MLNRKEPIDLGELSSDLREKTTVVKFTVKTVIHCKGNGAVLKKLN